MTDGRVGRARAWTGRAYRAGTGGLLTVALAGAVLMIFGLHPGGLGGSDGDGTNSPYAHAGGKAVVVAAGFPRNHLSVPNRSTLAPIAREGVDAQGFLGIPADVAHVGVFTGAGPLDGVAGDVVIAGHVNWVGQGTGYLGGLDAVHTGQIVVTRGKGKPQAWRIVRKVMYLKTRGLPQSIFRANGPRRLTLVTCGGKLDEQEHSYLSNVVVTAEPVRTVVRASS